MYFATFTKVGKYWNMYRFGCPAQKQKLHSDTLYCIYTIIIQNWWQGMNGGKCIIFGDILLYCTFYMNIIACKRSKHENFEVRIMPKTLNIVLSVMFILKIQRGCVPDPSRSMHDNHVTWKLQHVKALLKFVGNFVAKTVLVESASQFSLEELCRTQYSLKYLTKSYRPSDRLEKP